MVVGRALFSLSLSAVAALSANCNNGKDQVLTLPNLQTAYNKVPTIQYAGFVETNSSVNGELFYWFMEALAPRKAAADIPLVIWLNGGPGASSLMGLYLEMGMFEMHADETLTMRQYNWNTKYHMMFVDNPIGAGYSDCDENGYVTTEDQMGRQFVNLIEGFYACHPEYSRNPLYITGESYAGRYIPFIAKWILRDNGKIPLKGLAIGDGQFDPYIQFKAPVDYAYGIGVLDQREHDSVMKQVDYCLNVLRKIDMDKAAEVCCNVTNDIYAVYGGHIYQYDVREQEVSELSVKSEAMVRYCNRDDVKRAIHTTGHSFLDSDGTTEPNPVYNALKYDIMMNDTGIVIKGIMDAGIPIMFYNGQFDGSVWNNLGNKRFLNQMNYGGNWKAAVKRPVFMPGRDGAIGYVKQTEDWAKTLTYFVVSASGHLLPYDQPAAAKYMIETWIDGRIF